MSGMSAIAWSPCCTDSSNFSGAGSFGNEMLKMRGDFGKQQENRYTCHRKIQKKAQSEVLKGPIPKIGLLGQ